MRTCCCSTDVGSRVRTELLCWIYLLSTELVVDGVFVCNVGKAFLMSLEMIISVFPELKHFSRFHLWALNAPRSVQGPTQTSLFHPDQLSSFDF